jgi:hypothetical protein
MFNLALAPSTKSSDAPAPCAMAGSSLQRE